MKPNEIIHGFTVQSVRPLLELEARICQLEHQKSGARLVWLDRKEENKTFAIAFRTLPEDDTGVFHILEHSVLCGSDRYPTKEPFVELMKSSLQTFINAFTFPDKTMYPVCSRNDKDFANLVRVYMDAVLHPAIYHKPEIFRQEGWHYELKPGQAEPTYKGVVFNEMKGAYADKDSRMYLEIERQLYPDTAYRFESGGHPAHIPELTYERFLDAHRRFYAPSNSYIYLAGRMDIDAALAILDGEYLQDFTRRDDQPQFVLQAPVKSGLVRSRYEISPEEPAENKAQLGWGFVYGTYEDREEVMGVEVLADALCGGSEAPLKRRLVSQGLAQDVRVYSGLGGSSVQNEAGIQVTNLSEDRVDEVEAAIREELERLVREGLDHEQLSATLANLEFQYRERDYGRMPQGLGIGLSVMTSWLYGGDPAANLEVGPLFASLNKKLEEGWFEALLGRVFLKNDHCCRVLLTPSATLGEEERAEEAARLQAARDSWTEAEEAELRAQQEALDAWQNAEDTPEALAKLPVLRISDIPAKPEELPLEEGSLGDAPLLRHAAATGGIGYVNLYFDANDLTAEQLSCASLLGVLLAELETEGHTGAQLQKLQRSLMGQITASVEPYGQPNRPDTCRTFFCLSFSALEAKLEQAADLAAEILTRTKFDNQQRLRELLRQTAIRTEESVSAAGNQYAANRVSAGLTAVGAVKEYAAGISYCQWLKDTEKHFEDRGEDLSAALRALCEKLFTSGRLTVSVTGAEDAACAALEKTLLARLPRTDRQERPCAVRAWGVRKEGVIVPTDVSYAALGGSLLEQGASYSGKVLVAGKAAGLAYLWNAVRVQGGAYGVGVRPEASGAVCFWSFRDPSAVRSLGCYRQTADFLRQFAAGQPDLTGLIVGTVADFSPLLTPSKKGKTADAFYWSGVSYADRCERQEEILTAAAEDLAALAEPVQRLAEAGGVCVIGSRQLVEACGGELESIMTL